MFILIFFLSGLKGVVFSIKEIFSLFPLFGFLVFLFKGSSSSILHLTLAILKKSCDFVDKFFIGGWTFTELHESSDQWGILVVNAYNSFFQLFNRSLCFIHLNKSVLGMSEIHDLFNTFLKDNSSHLISSSILFKMLVFLLSFFAFFIIGFPVFFHVGDHVLDAFFQMFKSWFQHNFNFVLSCGNI